MPSKCQHFGTVHPPYKTSSQTIFYMLYKLLYTYTDLQHAYTCSTVNQHSSGPRGGGGACNGGKSYHPIKGGEGGGRNSEQGVYNSEAVRYIYLLVMSISRWPTGKLNSQSYLSKMSFSQRGTGCSYNYNRKFKTDMNDE